MTDHNTCLHILTIPLQVRDLVDDALVRAAPGQLLRATPAVAMAHLRSDLLPPPTSGTPVTPATAVAGLPVQVRQ